MRAYLLPMTRAGEAILRRRGRDWTATWVQGGVSRLGPGWLPVSPRLAPEGTRVFRLDLHALGGGLVFMAERTLDSGLDLHALVGGLVIEPRVAGGVHAMQPHILVKALEVFLRVSTNTLVEGLVQVFAQRSYRNIF